MRATFPLRLAAFAIIIGVCAGFAPTALADDRTDDPVEVNGRLYGSWSEYFLSDQFRAMNGRCATPAPEADLEKMMSDPSDCALYSTDPLPEYDPGAYYPIDIVVHIIMNSSGSQGQISDALVQSQIDILNEDYQALAGTPGAPGYDVGLVFRLAPTDPDGQPTTGITRSYNNTWFNDNGTYYNSLAWDPARYVNVYTNNAGGYLGYVPFLPQQGGVGGNSDRVVIHWQSLGRNSAGVPYDQGRTLTHELGHYFGLWHPFDNGCGSAGAPGCYTSGDYVCDTNTESSPQWGCSSSNTCGSFDNIHNYMDYTDDVCMWEFTEEQARRMRCTLENYRSDLLTVFLDVARTSPGAAPVRPVLRQNRPNPFNPLTELSYELPAAGQVTLRVHDVTGRLVRTLVDGRMEAGRHTSVWDGTDNLGGPAASGVYLYSLQSAQGSETKRMVLIR